MEKITLNKDAVMERNRLVTPEEWLAERIQLLNKEKELTRQYDQLCADRRKLPWVKIEKSYVFDGPGGKRTLAELFEGRSQLIVNHFMFGPEWKEGCVGCSFGADHVDGAVVHLEHHDVTYVAISRAPLPELEAFRRRMGWGFKWLSSFENDFNYDFHVSATKEEMEKDEVFYNYKMRKFNSEEMSGISVFYKDEAGEIYHTYSTYARGDELRLGTYILLDFTPKGRNEKGPNQDLSDWVRHHDRYDAGGFVDSTGRYQPAKNEDSCCGSGKADLL